MHDTSPRALRRPLALLAAGLLSAILTPAAPAAAQWLEGGGPNAPATATFGGAGQIAISGDLEAHLRSGWELRIHPAADYFIIHNLSLGGVLGLTYTSGEPSTTTVDLGARVGYNLAIAEQIGIWPRVGLFYAHTSRHPDSSSTAVLRLDAAFLYHLAPHLFVGLGPYFTQDIDGGGHGYGIDSTVGGWFGPL